MSHTEQDGPEYLAGLEVPSLTDAADEVVAVLQTITDPISRAWSAELAIRSATTARGRVAEVRRQALSEAHAVGKGWAEIGREFGISGARVQQIVQGRDR